MRATCLPVILNFIILIITYCAQVQVQVTKLFAVALSSTALFLPVSVAPSTVPGSLLSVHVFHLVSVAEQQLIPARVPAQEYNTKSQQTRNSRSTLKLVATLQDASA
jgi:hypothetical protein